MSLGQKVAVDVDGVLANFDEAASRIVNQIAPGTIKDPATYQPTVFGSWFGLESELWERILATNNFWLYLNAYPENVSALFDYHHSGPHVIMLCTARAATVGMSPERQTIQWLRSCGYTESPWGYLGVTAVEYSEYKAAVYAAQEIRFSVDDYGPTVAACNRMPGHHKAFLLDRPWNQEYDQPRVASLEEFFLRIGRIQ